MEDRRVSDRHLSDSTCDRKIAAKTRGVNSNGRFAGLTRYFPTSAVRGKNHERCRKIHPRRSVTYCKCRVLIEDILSHRFSRTSVLHRSTCARYSIYALRSSFYRDLFVTIDRPSRSQFCNFGSSRRAADARSRTLRRIAIFQWYL